MDVVPGVDQDLFPDVLSRDVDRGRARGLQHAQGPVRLGDELTTKDDADMAIDGLDPWRPWVVPDILLRSVRRHIPLVQGTHPTLRLASVRDGSCPRSRARRG